MPTPKPALRVPEPAWLSSRARNAARRPWVIATIAVIVVALAGVSMWLAPKNRRPLGPTPDMANLKIDTVQLESALATANVRVRSAESALVVVRSQVLAAAARPSVESLDPKALARHDSLTNVLTDLQSLIGKVETIPLPSSYRALAGSPALTASPRVHALLDSLSEVERERDSYGTEGGADPMYVALTSRVTEIGRSIEVIAGERRDSLRVQITNIATPTHKQEQAYAAAPDTMPWIAERDSAVSAVSTASADLSNARHALEARQEELARVAKISEISASPIAMVIAAAVFGIVFGFAGAFQSEIRKPTVSDGVELERATGVRLMSTVAPRYQTAEYDRRRADRLAPGYLDSKADAYQLAYLHIDQSVATPDVITVLGDDPDVSAIVAMNLAAIAADDARSVLVIDAAGRSDAIQSLLPFSAVADLSELIVGLRSWVDSTAHVSVGRDKSIDVVTGTQSAPVESLVELIERERARLGRTYDTVFVIGTFAMVPALADRGFAQGIVLTASSGRTRLSEIVQVAATLREKARQVSGVVLWDAPAPRLTDRPVRKTGGRRKAPVGRVDQAQHAAS